MACNFYGSTTMKLPIKKYVGALFDVLESQWYTSNGITVQAGLADWNVIRSVTAHGDGLLIKGELPDEESPIKWFCLLAVKSVRLGHGWNPKTKLAVQFPLPWSGACDTAMSAIRQLMKGKTVPVGEYTIQATDGSRNELPMPHIAFDGKCVSLTYSEPYPRLGQGALWASLRSVVFDRNGGRADLYRAVVGRWDWARDPVFTFE